MKKMPPTLKADVTASSERSLMVLSEIAKYGKPLSVHKLKQLTGLPQSTLYRYLKPLKKWGLIQERENLYSPGPLGVQLAWGFDQSSYLISHARPEMVRLVAKCNESVGLMVGVNHQVICLDMVDCEQSLRCSFSKGRSHSLVRGASAKAVLAHLPLPVIETVLDKQLQGDRAQMQRLQQELVLIRQQGYALSEGEVDWGVWGVSAPVFYSPAQAAGTITLMAPAIRAQEQQASLIAATLKAAEAISERLSLF